MTALAAGLQHQIDGVFLSGCMDALRLEAQSETALILPEFGCQCLSYSVGSLSVVAGPPNLDQLIAHPHRFGIPILFPWPGRIAGGRFQWRGRDFQLPINEPARGNAIHGTVCDRPFEVKRRGPYYVNCELDWQTQPNWEKSWPFPFTLSITYEVGNGLRVRARVLNRGDRPMPFGLGFHPYFHAPLSQHASRAALKLKLPGGGYWQLDDKLIPTGLVGPLPERLKFDGTRELGEAILDDVIAQVAGDAEGNKVCSMLDPALGVALRVRAAAQFSTWVAYAPAERPVLALEPYTCPPDAFNLASRGVEAGAIELAPGASWEGAVEIILGAP